MFDGTTKNLAQRLFSIIQYADLVGIPSEGDKVKLAVSRFEKDALSWWRQYVSQNNNAFASLDYDTFKNEIGSAFKDTDKELRLRKRLK